MKCIFKFFRNVVYSGFLNIAYRIAQQKIRTHAKTHPIKVLFFLSEVAKWKAQSLYDSLSGDARYEPIICIYPMQIDIQKTPEIVKEIQREKFLFFKNKNMNVLDVWDADAKCFKKDILKEPGMVFYQQPWDQPPAPSPIWIAMSHLTFYIPYYLLNYFDRNIDLCLGLQRQVFRHFEQSQGVVDFYENQVSKRTRAGKLVGLGHTVTDCFKIERTKFDYSVIYAPHFSIFIEGKNRICNYSTFLTNGDFVLDYAKSHPSVKWIFKPHPRLRHELVATGSWTKERVDNYYKAWVEIGQVCLTSDYQQLFVNSDLMITDCGSFLTEYSCVNKPLIRMVSPHNTQDPHPSLNDLFSTFYDAYDNNDLLSLMNMLIEHREDPKKDVRDRVTKKLGLTSYNVGQRIHEYLNQFITV